MSHKYVKYKVIVACTVINKLGIRLNIAKKIAASGRNACVKSLIEQFKLIKNILVRLDQSYSDEKSSVGDCRG